MKPYWHIHHDVLLEWSDNIEERIQYIRENKPKGEVETRLRLLREVKGELPQAYAKAGHDYDKTRQAYDKAWQDYVKAGQDFAKAEQAFVKAEQAYYKARPDYRKAEQAFAKEINALHAQECPDCPWNGHTIFPEETK